MPQQSTAEDDDWETDPDFVNDVTEEEQRWGSKTIVGSGRTAGAIEYVATISKPSVCFSKTIPCSKNCEKIAATIVLNSLSFLSQ